MTTTSDGSQPSSSPHRSDTYRSGAADEQHRLLNHSSRGMKRRRDHTGDARRVVLDCRDKAEVAAAEQSTSATLAAVSKARAEGEREAGRGRAIPRHLAWVLTVAALALLWEVDSTLLVTLLLGHLATILVTGVLVVASAVTAHLAGTLSREYHLAKFAFKELGRFKLELLRFSVIAGPTIEAGLGILRAAGTGALISALILSVAGVAIWGGLALLAFASFSPIEDEANRDLRRHRNHTRNLLGALHRLNSAETAYQSRRNSYQKHAQRGVEAVDIAAVHAVQHANLKDPVMDDLPRVRELRKVARGEMGELDLPKFVAPKPVLELSAPAPLPPPGPPALPPAGGWR